MFRARGAVRVFLLVGLGKVLARLLHIPMALGLRRGWLLAGMGPGMLAAWLLVGLMARAMAYLLAGPGVLMAGRRLLHMLLALGRAVRAFPLVGSLLALPGVRLLDVAALMAGLLAWLLHMLPARAGLTVRVLHILPMRGGFALRARMSGLGRLRRSCGALGRGLSCLRLWGISLPGVSVSIRRKSTAWGSLGTG